MPEVTSQFEKCTILKVRANDEDVKSYLAAHIKKLPSLARLDQQLQDEVETKIFEAADGMYVSIVREAETKMDADDRTYRFLLAQIYLRSLDDKFTTNAVRNALEDLRKQVERTGGDTEQLLDIAYDQAMDRISLQRPGLKNLAMKVLSWISSARRPLTTAELQCALTVRAGILELDPGDRPPLVDMLSVCAGLVAVDEGSVIIRLVHYTTQQYLEQTRSRWFPLADTDITITCVTYLSFRAFESGFCQTNEEFEERLRVHPLYDYAAQNWGHHARPVAHPCSPLLDFLLRDGNVEASAQALAVSKLTRTRHYSQDVPRQVMGVHLAAYFGLDSALSHLLNDANPNLKDSFNGTPLFYGSVEGHNAVVSVLLEKGAEVDAKLKFNRTP